MTTLLELLRVGRPPRNRIALSVLLGSLTVLAGVGLMGFAGYLISRSAEHPPVLSLTVAIVAVRAFGLLRPIARYFERLQSHDLAFRVLSRMRVGFYRALEPLVPARIEAYRRGDLLARMVGDVDAMQNLFLRGLSPPLVALVAGLVSVGVAAAILPAAGVVLAAGLLLGGIAVPFTAAAAGRRTGPRRVAFRAELTAQLVELLRGAPELVVLGADEAVMAKVGKLDSELVRLGRSDALIGGLIESLGAMVSGLTVVAVLAVSVQATSTGALDRVLIAALALLAMASFEAVAPLPAAALEMRTTLEAGRRLLAVAGREPAVSDPDEPVAPPIDETIALRSVGFDYADEESWGLHDVDLQLSPGRRVALVGQSGSGKSTVAALLVRFLDPDSGSVTVGGTDLRNLRQRDVRSVVSLDGQDAYLFASTIRENVRLGRPEADDAAVERALRRARVWEWVASLPDGLDTFVGEEGELVSGGERRRIALARTFAAAAPVVVLDEPTAHLDPATAEVLVADVLAASDGRSVLLITHGSEGLTQVDEVITLRRGSVVDGRSADASAVRRSLPSG